MANSFIIIGAYYLDTELVTVAGESVHRERDQIAGVGADDIAVVTDTDPSGSDHGLAVRPINVVNPITDALSSAGLAAGSSANLNGTLIASGATGKLMRVYVASSVACKWEIQTLDAAVAVSIGVLFTGGLTGRANEEWTPPDKRFDTLAYGDGDERFRVIATNLDQENAADVYSTIYWDEVS
jgi:hypothetical protein